MKVTHVALRPTEASEAAGRPSLTPELLAASGARYSRNNEGLEAILAKIDPHQLDKSVDGIFKMIDYGHQSIADMAPVAMFLDGISMLLAYLVWTQVPTAGGQESSTRYLRLKAEDLVDPATMGLPESARDEWYRRMEQAVGTYESRLESWQAVAAAEPERTRIPRALLDDPSDKAKKQVARMVRNFAFDRARNYLPVALRTNMMLVMSSRAWVQLSQWLLSHPLVEARNLGDLVVAELGLSAPRLLRHATAKPSFQAGLDEEWNGYLANWPASSAEPCDAGAFLDVFEPRLQAPNGVAASLAHHDNRYAYFGPDLQRTAVRFGWEGIAMAEIRDLNRHRTGTKFCPLVPVGFEVEEQRAEHRDAALLSGIDAWTKARAIENDPSAVYGLLLGHQFKFEHTTTADKFIYEAELRTGVGAHFKYADHLRAMLSLWYAKYPETKGLVLEGSAEPE